MRTDNPWQTLSSEIKYQNPWIRVREDKVITPLGTEGIYGIMESNDSVMVTVLNDKNELYLIRTFAYPVQSWNWELPGGGGDKEDAMVASQRELEEETGIRATTWDKLGITRVCNGLMTEKMTTYLARDLSFDGEKEADSEQIDQGKFYPMSEVDNMIAHGDINDSQSISGIYLAQKWLERGTQK